MKTFNIVTILAIIVLSSSMAGAGCYNEGVTYDEGATICSNGWLMQCTASGSWGAIGYCQHETRNPDLPGISSLFNPLDENQQDSMTCYQAPKERTQNKNPEAGDS